MSVLNPLNETIKLYAKQLRTPSFSRYENIVRQLSPGDGYDKFLCELMKLELSQRQEAGQRRRIKKASFPVMKTLDEFNFSRLEHVSEAYIHELASCDFIKNRQNIVMIGTPGSGKTHLSTGLGIKACYAGFNVKFYTAVNLANELAEAVQFHRLSKLEKSLSKVELLIIDELSYLTYNRHQSEMLFQVISERSERASIIVTTNLEFSRWTDLFENEMMVAALIDRITFRSHILNMNMEDSDSYRLEQTLLNGKEVKKHE
ncbi:IS21-like element helper ATPase IstB [Desulfotomaculum sp. 1211_IL3151]|uniref:IS21-like element helper ATPase IstB n=1 Tax=Desulfotomaculum sp. 1211_IL3151 TaxID=3084055 RepID=UPI002FDB7AA3